MTPEERNILIGLQADMHELMKFRAEFMEVPLGSPKDTPTLLTDLRTVVATWAWISRTSRFAVIVVPIITTIVTAISAVFLWIKTGGLGQ